jgi:hypothetical protein
MKNKKIIIIVALLGHALLAFLTVKLISHLTKEEEYIKTVDKSSLEQNLKFESEPTLELTKSDIKQFQEFHKLSPKLDTKQTRENYKLLLEPKPDLSNQIQKNAIVEFKENKEKIKKMEAGLMEAKLHKEKTRN